MVRAGIAIALALTSCEADRKHYSNPKTPPPIEDACMAAKPSGLPVWATNPPAAPPTTISAPSAAQQASGWQLAGSTEYPLGKPVLQHMNWYQNLVGQWCEWLEQSTARFSWLRNQVLWRDPSTISALSDLTGIDGQSFVQAAGHIRGPSVILDGYRLELPDLPAHTYAANSDTYWDADVDGGWTATAVASGAAEPALASGSIRVLSVRTDGSVITSGLGEGSGFSDFNAGLRFAEGLTIPFDGFTQEVGDIGNFSIFLRGETDRGADSSISDATGKSRYIIHGSGSAYSGHVGEWIGLLVNAAPVQRSVDASTAVTSITRSDGTDSYFYVFSESGLEILFRDGSLADTWTNELDAVNGWSRVAVFGESIELQTVAQPSGTDLTLGNGVLGDQVFTAGDLRINGAGAIAGVYQFRADFTLLEAAVLAEASGTAAATAITWDLPPGATAPDLGVLATNDHHILLSTPIVPVIPGTTLMYAGGHVAAGNIAINFVNFGSADHPPAAVGDVTGFVEGTLIVLNPD